MRPDQGGFSAGSAPHQHFGIVAVADRLLHGGLMEDYWRKRIIPINKTIFTAVPSLPEITRVLVNTLSRKRVVLRISVTSESIGSKTPPITRPPWFVIIPEDLVKQGKSLKVHKQDGMIR